ncbi:conserved hypothetical protein [uncultured Desulfatiglans sp.]|nr:conserved hypothetical protein [uncultured Desulfatiglans sp.]
MSMFRVRILLRVLRRLRAAPSRDAGRSHRKSVRFLAVDLPLILILETINRICLILDECFFRNYRNTPIEKPVFMVGPPRSGTTFLHRLLFKDNRFTSLALWEILFAPSILQKKFLLALARIDRRRGNPVYHRIVAAEERFLSGPMHRTSLFDPEEDEMLLVRTFSSGHFLIFLFPFEEEFRPLIYFDTELPKLERYQIMNFYKQCVQRHMYVFGKGKRFLSKNPGFSIKMQSLQHVFTDASFIYLARTPFESVPSNLSLFYYVHQKLPTATDDRHFVDFILGQMKDYYLYPLEKMGQLPKNKKAVVLYSDLIRNPDQTVRALYRQIEWPLTPSFAEILKGETSRAASFLSEHEYSLEQFGLSFNIIREKFREIFDIFGFETPFTETPSANMKT